MSTDQNPPAEPPPSRVASVNTYRGAVMFLMMAEVLRLSRVARSFPDSPVWQNLAYHQSHVEWGGCSVHDMIQPSFSFLVGRGLAVLDGRPGPPGGVNRPGRSSTPPGGP